ncbi:hypothetical protein [Bosea sp. 2YAB26]|uniref:hypothetical protein n=1 Tax=Bosea sp. 2YAB26 TaxID=3237478 RepID=UPI003F9103DB
MTADEYRHAIKRLGLNQTTIAPLLGITARTSQRYAANGAPATIRRLLAYIEHYGDTLD